MAAAHIQVLKFGGTSLASPGRMRRAARRVAAHVRSGRGVVVVASAIGHTTDRLLEWAARAARPASHPDPRELDRALATGEDRSAALLALALTARGVSAESLRGGEAGVRVDGSFGSATITDVDPAPLLARVARGIVPVVAGFQGTAADGETMTVGRGGSDATAVAIAAALGSACCHLITDVDAIYTADPVCCSDAVPIRYLSLTELVTLAEAGAHVVHPAAARLALSRRVPIRVYDARAPLRRPGGTFVRPDAAADRTTPCHGGALSLP